MIKIDKKFILYILYIILVLMIICLGLILFRKQEGFNSTTQISSSEEIQKISNNEIYSIVLEPFNPLEKSYLTNKFYGTYLSEPYTDKKYTPSILNTSSMGQDNGWDINKKFENAYNKYRIKNKIPKDLDIIPYNITFTKITEPDGNKYYMIIIMKEINKKNTIGCRSGYKGCIFNIYKLDLFQDSNDIELIKVTNYKNPKKNIICLLYYPNPLTYEPTYLGVNFYDGFIYETDKPLDKWIKDTNGDYWIGPIGNSNIDEPRMNKIMYDKDNFLIGIGRDDNNIYRKTGINFKNPRIRWDKKKLNKIIDPTNTNLVIKTYDLIYDKDGCLIATTSNGILKQTSPEFSSGFVSIKTFELKNDDILNELDILQYKTGCDFYDYMFDVTEENHSSNTAEFKSTLKDIYEFKKQKINECQSNKIHSEKVSKLNDDGIEDLQNRNAKLEVLRNKINEISNYL